MSEEKKGNGLFWAALLLLGGGAIWAIEKFMVAPKTSTPKTKNGGSNNNSGSTQTQSGSNNNQTTTNSGSSQSTNIVNTNQTTNSGGTQTPAVKDYTTNIQYSTFPTPDVLINTDPNLDYQMWYLNNWIWFNKNDIMTELAKPYWNWGTDSHGNTGGVNFFYFTQQNDADAFKSFTDYDQTYKNGNDLVIRVSPFVISNVYHNYSQNKIDDSLIKEIQNKTGLSLSKATEFLDRIRNNPSFDIKGYIQDNH
jgi:hypothetical protein